MSSAVQRTARRIGVVVIAVLTSLGLALTMTTAPAQANSTEADLRSTVHARLAVFLDDAVSSDLYTETQRRYVLSIISTSAPDSLSARQERRVLGVFWQTITEVGGVSRSQAENRLQRGATLTRVTGSDSDAVRNRLRSWLLQPVVRAVTERNVTWSEVSGLVSDTTTAVNRLMAQPGGQRDVILVRKRN